MYRSLLAKIFLGGDILIQKEVKGEFIVKYFLRGIIAAILFGVLMIGGLMTGFMVLCYLAVPPMLYMYYCLFQVIIAIIKVMAKGASKTVEVGTKVASLPRKMKQEAEAEKERKEREQVEANLQAKIKAEAVPYKAMADNGDTTAMKEVARVYYKNGKEKEARNLYENAADKGDVGAQLTLAENYKQIGAGVAMKWASRAEENVNADEEQKKAAQRRKQDIVEFEQLSERIRAEAQERQRQVREQQRREEEAYQAWKQNEMQTPVTGDYFVPRTDGETCRNKGQSCRYCARRRWYPGGWGDDDCRIGM